MKSNTLKNAAHSHTRAMPNYKHAHSHTRAMPNYKHAHSHTHTNMQARTRLAVVAKYNATQFLL